MATTKRIKDVVVYISSVANFQRHPRKVACLESFAKGVRQHGDTVHIETNFVYQPSRLAVILGWATTNTGGRNIALRKEIIRNQEQLSQHTMCIDGSCWKYIDSEGKYLRYSIGGPFYDTAEYANHNSTSTKWEQISKDLLVPFKMPQYRPDGYIAICMQRDGGFAMKTLNPIEWLKDKITEIRKVTNRPILVRPHPGAFTMSDFDFLKRYKAVTVVDPLATSLLANLKGAQSAVFFNSSSCVPAIIEGVPVFVDDQSCVGWNVANKSIANIEQPEIFNREQWLYDLASAHWTDEEGQRGLIYEKFLPYLR